MSAAHMTQGHTSHKTLTAHRHLPSLPQLPQALRSSTSAARTHSRHLSRGASHVVVKASLFDRFGRATRGTANYYGEGIVRQLEDPNRLLDTIVSDIQSDLVKMRQAYAEVMSTQKLLEAKYNKAKEIADDWYKRAELALQNGKEDLAREALQRRQTNQVTANQLKIQLDQHTKATDTLRGNIRILEAKLAEAKEKKATLKARALSAQSTIQVNADLKNMMKGLQLTGGSALAAIDRMEEKVLALEAEAEATAQMSVSNALEAAFVDLERGAGVINDDLQKLKADMRQQGKILPGSLSQPASRSFIEFDIKPPSF